MARSANPATASPTPTSPTPRTQPMLASPVSAYCWSLHSQTRTVMLPPKTLLQPERSHSHPSHSRAISQNQLARLELNSHRANGGSGICAGPRFVVVGSSVDMMATLRTRSDKPMRAYARSVVSQACILSDPLEGTPLSLE